MAPECSTQCPILKWLRGQVPEEKLPELQQLVEECQGPGWGVIRADLLPGKMSGDRLHICCESGKIKELV